MYVKRGGQSALEYRSASVPAAACLAQSAGKGDELAAEEGITHSPSPPSSERRKSQLSTSQLSEARPPLPAAAREGWSLGNTPGQRDFCSPTAHRCVVAIPRAVALYRECWSESGPKPGSSAPRVPVTRGLLPRSAHL